MTEIHEVSFMGILVSSLLQVGIRKNTGRNMEIPVEEQGNAGTNKEIMVPAVVSVYKVKITA